MDDTSGKSDREPDQDVVDIVYYTDPLCCWSWGMESGWRLLQSRYAGKMRWRYCMGGLLPNWKQYHDSINSVSRPAQMGPVWMEAAHLTGTAINHTIWMQDPPSSSYLACVAVKCAGLQSAQAEDLYLAALRRAVMSNGINISFESALLDIAAAQDKLYPDLLDLSRFSADLAGNAGLEAFRSDLQEVQYRQVTRFPTMIFRRKNQEAKIIVGYRPKEELFGIMDHLLNGAAQPSAGMSEAPAATKS